MELRNRRPMAKYPNRPMIVSPGIIIIIKL